MTCCCGCCGCRICFLPTEGLLANGAITYISPKSRIKATVTLQRTIQREFPRPKSKSQPHSLVQKKKHTFPLRNAARASLISPKTRRVQLGASAERKEGVGKRTKRKTYIPRKWSEGADEEVRLNAEAEKSASRARSLERDGPIFGCFLGRQERGCNWALFATIFPVRHWSASPKRCGTPLAT